MSSDNNADLKEKYEDLLRKWTSIEGFDRGFLNQCNLEKLEKGKIVVSMIVKQENCNILSTLHGGAIATLIDIISSIAIISTNMDQIAPSVSVDIGVNYASAAPVDRKIFIVSSVYKQGRNLAFTDTTIYLDSEDSGIVVAKGSHTKFLPVVKKSKL